MPIRCGATPIPVQSRLCRGTLRYPTAWLARSVATFRYQKSEPSSPAKKPGIGRELPLLAKAVPNKRMEPVVAATEAEAIAQVTEALGH
jgi:hypothetical protein